MMNDKEKKNDDNIVIFTIQRVLYLYYVIIYFIKFKLKKNYIR